ncbi:glyoxalase [Modestobacter sp. Leaf380]|nr:glyoxalase [Modestobacter sp. Leaf380]
MGGAVVQLGEVRAVTVFVEDLGAAREFYASVFGGRVVAEDEVSTAFEAGPGVVVNLLQVDQAAELVTPGEVAAPGGSRVLLTVAVADVDAECARLAELGVPLRNGPQDRPWGVRTAAFADPAGHVWELAGPLRTG